MSRATCSAYTKPEQAAEMSKQGMSRRRPSLACSRQAVEGKGTSGVIVATMSRSTSAGVRPARARAWADAFAPRSEGFSPGPAIRRSAMPERVLIHSSDVSTIRESSALVSVREGTPTPMARMKTDGSALLIDA